MLTQVQLYYEPFVSKVVAAHMAHGTLNGIISATPGNENA